MNRSPAITRTVAAALALPALAACATTAPEPAAERRDAVVATTDHFVLRSEPRVALHHFLRDWALADADEWPPWAPPVRERGVAKRVEHLRHMFPTGQRRVP